MATRPHIYPASTTTDVPESAANTETVILTLGGVSSEFPNQAIILVALAAITLAASTTAMTLRIRQQSLTGTLVGEAVAQTGDIAASKISVLSCFATDTSVEVAGMTYVLTMQATAGGSAANCTASNMVCTIA